MYRQRFGLSGHPFPKNAQGKTLFTEFDGYKKLARAFQLLTDEPGVGLLTAEPGVGKTASIRNLCHSLPQPQYRVIYLCDTAISQSDLYRSLAMELGVRPAHRRAALWRDLKARILQLVDDKNEHLVVIIDEAQNLSDAFFADFAAFLNFAFDSRDLFTTWLVGQPRLRARLGLQHYAALQTRLAAKVHLEAFTKRDLFQAFFAHGIAAAGAKGTIIADSARDLLFRGSRGLPREVGKIVRRALRLAHEKAQSFVDDPVMEAAIAEEADL
ncbi:MAG TPA: AAA family ATPase [Candidatus Polarisedimenticolia bacterium]|nr:AAA family ATPase [Candidatus Polarisedimenticolia bacterium]